MSWAIGYSGGRDIGYGVPATCDYPTCKKKIDRGLSYCCGGYFSDSGCGLYFCSKHRGYEPDPQQIEDGVDPDDADWIELCERCVAGEQSFNPKPDRPVWIRWKLKHRSWKQWRDENPEKVKEMQEQLKVKSSNKERE